MTKDERYELGVYITDYIFKKTGKLPDFALIILGVTDDNRMEAYYIGKANFEDIQKAVVGLATVEPE